MVNQAHLSDINKFRSGVDAGMMALCAASYTDLTIISPLMDPGEHLLQKSPSPEDFVRDFVRLYNLDTIEAGGSPKTVAAHNERIAALTEFAFESGLNICNGKVEIKFGQDNILLDVVETPRGIRFRASREGTDDKIIKLDLGDALQTLVQSIRIERRNLVSTDHGFH
jgi:hypothetical protein